MMGRHHLMVGCGLVSVGTAAAVGAGRVPVSAGLLAVAFGTGMALAPDFDEPGSSAPRTFGWLGRGLAVLVAWLALGHRGATHTVEVAVGSCAVLAWSSARWPLVAPVVVACAVAVAVDGVPRVGSFHALVFGAGVGWWAWSEPGRPWWLLPGAALVGWLAHMVCDAPTPHGIPVSLVRLLLGRPCVKVGGRRGWFTTGSGKETAVAWLSTLGCGGLVWVLAAPELHQQFQAWSGSLRVAG